MVGEQPFMPIKTAKTAKFPNVPAAKLRIRHEKSPVRLYRQRVCGQKDGLLWRWRRKRRRKSLLERRGDCQTELPPNPRPFWWKWASDDAREPKLPRQFSGWMR